MATARPPPRLSAALVAAGAVIGQLVAGKAVRDAIFLAHFDLRKLPGAMLIGAGLAAVAIVLVSRAASRFGPGLTINALLTMSALAHVAEWALEPDHGGGVALALYIHTSFTGGTLVSVFYMLVGERFDAHTAKKVIGKISAAGTLGGFFTALLAWLVGAQWGARSALLLLALVSLLAVWGTWSLTAAEPITKKVEAAGRIGLVEGLRSSPFLRELGLVVFCSSLIIPIVAWLLGAHAATRFSGDALLSFFAIMNAATSIVSFVAEAYLSQRLLQRLGLAATASADPIVVGVAAALSIFAPGLIAVTALAAASAFSRAAFSRTAYELFFAPLRPEVRRSVKAAIDVGIDKLGGIVASGLLLIIARASLERASQIALAAIVVLSIALLVFYRLLGRAYVAGLDAYVRAEVAVLPDDDSGERLTLIGASVFPPSDPELTPAATIPSGDTVVAKLIELRSADEGRILGALAGPLEIELVPATIALLENDAVAKAAVASLRQVALRVPGALVDALLDPMTSVHVRRRLPRVLGAVSTPRIINGLYDALRDPSFEVRVQVALALESMLIEGTAAPPDHRVFEAALFELTEGRPSWRAMDADLEGERQSPEMAGLTHVFTVLGLVLGRESLAASLRALHADDPALRGLGLEYLDAILPVEVREALAAVVALPPAGPPSRAAPELARELILSMVPNPPPDSTA